MFVCGCLLGLTGTGFSAEDEELITIHGRVVDASGNPISGVRIGTYWGANGLTLPRLQQILANQKTGVEPDIEEMYGQKGTMEPWGVQPTESDDQGHFHLMTTNDRHWAMAIDANQKHGALVLFDAEQPDQKVEVRLQPLCRVTGSVRVKEWEAQPDWAVVILNMPRSDRFPLAVTRLVMCGTLDNDFELFVPPGEYAFESNTDSDPMAYMLEEKRMMITADQREYDAGVLELAEEVKQEEVRGIWNDFREHYGEAAPKLHVTEARGVASDIQIADFKGKWVLIYFWSPWCRPCLANGVPKLMDVHTKHADNDRVRILSVCLGNDSDSKTLEDLDVDLDPVVRNVWKRPIKFPILLDTSRQTYANFGLDGVGYSLVFDPEGNLVEGDMDSLEEILE